MLAWMKSKAEGLWESVDHQRMLRLVILLLIGGLALLGRLWVGPQTLDDAYITFRYARNLADGFGFVYNYGERVLGTTTPLYTLLLAALYRLGAHDLPLTAVVINSLADAMTTVLLFSLAQRLGMGRGWAALLAILFAVNPFSMTYASAGMESSFFTLWLMAALVAHCSGRATLSGLAAGLATLTRPEGVLVAALIGGERLVRLRLPSWRMSAGYLMTLLPWVVYAWWWFGDLVPQSVRAKAVAYSTDPLDNLWRLGMQLSLPGFNAEVFGTLFRGDLQTITGIALSIGMAVIVLPHWRSPVRFAQRMPQVWPLVLFAPLLFASYALAGLRNVVLFDWYLVPLVPFYLLALVAAAWATQAGASRPAIVRVTALYLAWTALGFGAGSPGDAPLVAPRGRTVVREEGYAAAARLLDARVGSGTVIALPEIGAFGYVTAGRVLDTVGLVSPEATQYYPLPEGVGFGNMVPPRLIACEQPDYIVGLDQFLQAPLLDAPWFQSGYRPLARFETRALRSREMVVYERVATSPDGCG